MNEMTPQECAEVLLNSGKYSIIKIAESRRYASAVMRKLAAGELVEVKHAHWKIINNSYFCSACGDENYESTEYCPSCGADMDGKDDNNAE
jgi:hypothetical protein